MKSSSSVILVAILAVVLVATQTEAQSLLPGVNLGIRVNVSGIVSCSVNANTTAPPFANATVQLVCLQRVIATTITNQRGEFAITLNALQVPLNALQVPVTALLSSNPLTGCVVNVTTPLARCNATLPVTGALQGPLQFVGTTVTGLLGLTLNFLVGVLQLVVV